MKRIFSSTVFALAAGLCLRLLFVLQFPADSGDTSLYEELATNWLKHHVYGVNLQGAITPVDVRMPGYPAYLAFIYALSGRTGEAARLWVMLGQVAVDIIGCLFCVWLARLLLTLANPHAEQKPVLRAAWWLAMLCPFTANYTAVPLTETFAIALTSVAAVFLVGLAASADEIVLPKPLRPLEWKNEKWKKDEWKNEERKNKEWTNEFRHWAVPAGLAVGLATLFRPESPLILIVAWGVTAFQLFRHRKLGLWLRIVAYSGLACILPLVPWAIRNAVNFHEAQFLTPKYSTMPGELVPQGFMAWENTWLYRMRDCYAVPWKLNEEAINVGEIPARAFDSPEEKQRVAAILELYNQDSSLTQEEDDAFAQIARERVAHHPLRTWLWIPAARAITIWFSPRIELLPISGNVFPLAEMHDRDPADQGFTTLLFFLNIVYVGLAVWGAAKLWRFSALALSHREAEAAARPAIAFLIIFIVLRTAFLTTLETPEPRYVLECFPILIALAAQLFAAKPSPAQVGSYREVTA